MIRNLANPPDGTGRAANLAKSAKCARHTCTPTPER